MCVSLCCPLALLLLLHISLLFFLSHSFKMTFFTLYNVFVFQLLFYLISVYFYFSNIYVFFLFFVPILFVYSFWISLYVSVSISLLCSSYFSNHIPLRRKILSIFLPIFVSASFSHLKDDESTWEQCYKDFSWKNDAVVSILWQYFETQVEERNVLKTEQICIR